MAEPAVAEPRINNNENHAQQDEDPDVAEMERLMALQEQEEEQEEVTHHADEDIQDEDQVQFHNEGDNEQPVDPNDVEGHGFRTPSRSLIKMHYTTVSFIAAAVHIIYVLRTRKQVYLALLYLTSSKLSYILLGNGVMASFYRFFQFMIRKFMNGLRLMETETIMDHIRWNVTETCIALTMFRQEISVKTMGIFLVIILGKCLHWATELRTNHLRMTEEVFYFLSDGEFMFGVNNINPTSTSQNGHDKESIWWVWKAIGIFMPQTVKDVSFQMHQGLPRVRLNHLKIVMLLNILYIFDVLALSYCASHLLEDGPSIYIMFLFETSILMVSVTSSSTLYGIHVFDGFLNVLQRLIIDGNIQDHGDDITGEHHDQSDEVPETQDGGHEQIAVRDSLQKNILQQVASVWRDQRITATFIVELMALASKFLFHLILFAVVSTLYGLPINIIRDFYMAFTRLKQRLVAFSSYRRLTSNMNSRFESVKKKAELEAAGGTCIICRDKMEVKGIHGDCKKLPICGHTFHKHCLREWLVQQQSCPTCRGDIQVNEARAKAMAKATQEEEQEIVPLGEGEGSATGGTATIENKEADIQTDKESVNIFSNPVLCKIIASDGAFVWEADNAAKKCRSRIRTITCGQIVVFTASSKLQCDGSGLGHVLLDHPRTEKYLKAPDGWIVSSALEEIMELKPTNKSK